MDNVLQEIENPRLPLCLEHLDDDLPGPVRLDLAMEKLTLELWMAIGEMFLTKCSLLALRSACRQFNHIYTPILFSRIKLVSLNDMVSDKFLEFLSLPPLKHVRNLAVIANFNDIHQDWTLSPQEQGSRVNLFNQRLAQCFKAMPNLTSFSYDKPSSFSTSSEQSFSGLGLVPLFNKTVSALRDHNPRLRDLSIAFYLDGSTPLDKEEVLEYEEFEFFKYTDFDMRIDIGGFSGLSSLRLFGIYGDASSNIKGLVSTLLASPNLEELDISLHFLSETQDFFPRICKAYAAAGGRPFQLKRLSLGKACVPYEDETSYIPLLCNMGTLQDVYTSNHFERDYHQQFPRFFRHEKKFAYATLFDPSWCHSIKHISAKMLDKDLFRIIKKVGQDTSLPPHFLSEMSFKIYDFKDVTSERFDVAPDKRIYWPKIFSIEHTLTEEENTTDRHALIREMFDWRGLERLHLPGDMKNYQERKLIADLIQAHRKNLKVLSIRTLDMEGMQRSFDFSETDDFGGYTLYSEDWDTGDRLPWEIDDMTLCYKLTKRNRMSYAKHLCLESNLSYLGLFDCYYMIRKDNVKGLRGKTVKRGLDAAANIRRRG